MGCSYNHYTKENGTVRFISDFRNLNEMLKRMPYPIPKIAQMLQELEFFAYATSLDLNMGYYTIKIDSDAQKMCTIAPTSEISKQSTLDSIQTRTVSAVSFAWRNKCARLLI
jgi:hypothetical protein